MRALIPKIPSRNVRSKKSKNPGYIGGNHWVLCDRCGCSVREADSRITWEGFVVCLDDWEPRHPQDFVRARQDRIAPEGNVRPQGYDRFLGIGPNNSGYLDRNCVTGYAISGEAVSGFINQPPITGTNNNLL